MNLVCWTTGVRMPSSEKNILFNIKKVICMLRFCCTVGCILAIEKTKRKKQKEKTKGKRIRK